MQARSRASKKTSRRQLGSRSVLPPCVVNTRSSGLLPRVAWLISWARNREFGTGATWASPGRCGRRRRRRPAGRRFCGGSGRHREDAGRLPRPSAGPCSRVAGQEPATVRPQRPARGADRGSGRCSRGAGLVAGQDRAPGWRGCARCVPRDQVRRKETETESEQAQRPAT